MAEQMRPASNKEAPNAAVSYERADPHRESGMGSLAGTKQQPSPVADKMEQSISNKQDSTKQINAQETINERGGVVSGQPDHSMMDEEPLGADQRPIEATRSEDRRFPRTGGKGGTPDAGETPGRS